MHWSNTRVLVTGGASFIGSHLVEALLRAGAANVRVADDLSSGKLANLAEIRSDIDFVRGDLRDINFAQRAMQGCEVVFHLAADHGGRGYISNHPANCAGNMALDNTVFRSAMENDVDRILFASSACVYPTHLQAGKQLLKEEMVSFDKPGGAFADEEYGWAKLMGELSLRAYHRQHGIKAACARISTAFGPRENESHAIIALIAKAFVNQSPFEIWGDGEQTRGFTYVDDVVQGLILACQHIDDSQAVNVGTDEFISLNRVAEQIFSLMNWQPGGGVKHLTDKPVGVTHRALDTTFAQRTTGWKPRVPFDEGIRRTVEWYVANNTREDVAARLDHFLMER